MALADTKFLTVSEVADILRLHRSTIQRLAATGELPGAILIKTGSRGTYRIPESAINALVVKSESNIPSPVVKEDINPNPFPSLRQFSKRR